MKLNQQFEQVRQSPTVSLADRVAKLKRSGRKVIGLQVGDPDFPTPPAVLETAIRAMNEGLTHYCPSRGFLDLREAIADALKRRAEEDIQKTAPYHPESEILVTHGGVHAFFLAMQSILNPGDEVLVPDPDWATHCNIIHMVRGSAVRVPAPVEHGFIPPIAAWESARSPKARAIVINYPGNPTGVYPARDYLERLLEWAAEHDLWVVSDEVYDHLYYEGKPVSACAFSQFKDSTILINSFSKTYAMTGWRVGYIAAPAHVIDNALKGGQNSITCIAPFVQKAAAFALTDAGVQKAVTEMRGVYDRRRKLVMEITRNHARTPVRVIPPMGAFYFFLDFRALKISSLEICERILEEAGVALVPGSAFGAQGEGFARMTIAASDQEIKNGFNAVLEWAENV